MFTQAGVIVKKIPPLGKGENIATRQWYYLINGSQEGPVLEEHLRQLFQLRQLQPETMVWTQGLKNWVIASSVKGLVPPTSPTYPPPPPSVYQTRSAEQQYAGFWKRFAAAFIDSIILTVLGGVVGFVIGFVYGATTGTAEGVKFLGGIGGVIIGWLYSAALESSEKQATLGKMALGIKVTDLNGRRISFGKATGRHFGKILSSLIVGIGYLMVAFTTRKQGLHDMMAGCLVVNK